MTGFQKSQIANIKKIKRDQTESKIQNYKKRKKFKANHKKTNWAQEPKKEAKKISNRFQISNLEPKKFQFRLPDFRRIPVPTNCPGEACHASQSPS